MGLDLSVNGEHIAHWSYSGFNAFRKMVAKSAGFDLEDMEGFSRTPISVLVREGTEAFEKLVAAEGTKVSWDNIENPIKYLLHHSDCDGNLQPEFCGLVADALEEILEFWTDEIEFNSSIFSNYDKVQGLRLVDGLRRAVELNVPLEFH